MKNIISWTLFFMAFFLVIVGILFRSWSIEERERQNEIDASMERARKAKLEKSLIKKEEVKVNEDDQIKKDDNIQ